MIRDRKWPAILSCLVVSRLTSGSAIHTRPSRQIALQSPAGQCLAAWLKRNTNGLLRQFFPKGTDLSDLSQTTLNDVARLMNDRPRKSLGWNTPAEAMAEELAAIKTTVALQT
jgi:IS30 family transposase